LTGSVAPAVLAEQIAYYRARAAEYDEWWERLGRYDRGDPATAAWRSEVAQVRAALAELPIDKADVLELAPGTGIWTRPLAARAARVVAVDAAPEMIAENRRRLGELAGRVHFVRADLFQLPLRYTADVVVFCFWISHIPRERLDAFLTTVANVVRPGGMVFFLDGRPAPEATAVGDVLPGPGHQLMTRRLNDGRPFRVVKNFWTGAQLRQRFAAAGLRIEVRETPTYFQYGVGHRVDSAPEMPSASPDPIRTQST
jgi:demethylmenaquinone methyltransferase/2-methoxy-6-polyprenyl-1,4-benzoquinol methylase